ncbi:unnamed protein product [Arabidopsis thaliana]|uniref:(thale cress) hypothetical protein n=1 Tax=Arabidopsis thaliana TaxID=3702 RepID=A0A7G2EAG1_ARATH|nr:unnamed protein product [Arabidopsis thaliana]
MVKSARMGRLIWLARETDDCVSKSENSSSQDGVASTKVKRKKVKGSPYGENEKLEPSESAEKTHDPGTSSPFDPTRYTKEEMHKLKRRMIVGNEESSGFKAITTCYGIIWFVRFLEPYYIFVTTNRKASGMGYTVSILHAGVPFQPSKSLAFIGFSTTVISAKQFPWQLPYPFSFRAWTSKIGQDLNSGIDDEPVALTPEFCSQAAYVNQFSLVVITVK